VAGRIGQTCLAPGMMKSTYGARCFAILNTRVRPVASRHGLLSTIAYRLHGETA
jgi:glycerol kinase